MKPSTAALKFISLTIALGWLALPSLPLRAQEAQVVGAPDKGASFEESYQQARAKNPTGLKFTVDLGDKTQFHRGEIIPIHLNFSSEPYGGYELDPRNYDRAGRLNLTDFFITDRPHDAVDPLGDYFSINPFGFGGLSALPKPVNPVVQTVALTLNEYLRFDKAGHYRLYVQSKRLFRAEKPSVAPFSGTSATSEMVEFDILEGEAWAENRAREIQAFLGAPVAKAAPINDYADETRYGALARKLRFLDTPLSRRLMIAHYGNPKFRYNGDFSFGLIGTRDPNDAIAALREHLQNPEGAIPSGLLRDWTTLLFAQSDAPALPPFPREAAATSAEMKQFRALQKVREEKRSAITRALLADLQRALPLKRGAARAISLSTALENLGAARQMSSGLDVADDAALPTLRRQLIASWNDLPRPSQAIFLGYRWPLMRDATLLPILVRAHEASPRLNSNQSDNFEERQWRSLLLARINQLSPAVGRKYLLAEMARPDPRVDSGVLLDLPDARLPALESVWLENLRHYLENYSATPRVAQLVARYASIQIATPLKAWFDKAPNLSSETRAALLAYFARVRPEQSGALIEAEIAAHKEPILEAIGAFTMNVPVEAVAVKYLGGANRWLAGDAARALAAYGSPAAEAVLWARLEKWHAALQGETLDNAQIDFEATLSQALLSMPGVRSRRANVEKLRALCLSESARARLSDVYFPTNGFAAPEILYYPILFNNNAWSMGSNGSGYLSLQSLTRKLRQFPRGTLFSLRIEGSEAAPDVQSLVARLQSWLQPRGYKLKLVSRY